MQYTKLDQTDIKISQIGLGLWNISGGSDWEKTNEKQALETIYTAYENDITFFDTAEAYGDGYSEAVLGEALKSMNRDDIVVASKVSPENLGYDDLKEACEASLKRLGTDHIDIYYIHYQNPEIPLSETMQAITELQDAGKIRVPAVSNTGVKDLEETLSHVCIEVNQVPYNLLWRAIEYEILKSCCANNLHVVAYSSLAQGLLTGKFSTPEEFPDGRMRTRHFSCNRPTACHGENGAETEVFQTIDRVRQICTDYDYDMVEVALTWPLHQSGIASVLAGASSPEHVEMNAKMIDTTLSDDILRELNEATVDLKETLGPNPDPWKSDSRYR